MTCILARGFEHGSTYDFDWVNEIHANISASTGAKRTGGYSNYGAYLYAGRYGYMNFPAVSEFYFQMWCKPYNTFATSGPLLKWQSDGTILGTLYFDSTTRLLKLYTGDNANLVATGTTVLTPGYSYILELHIKIADASGILELRLNGITDCIYEGAGADTKPGADTTVNRMLFTVPANSLEIYIDDIIINNTDGAAPGNTWPSGAYVTGLIPSGAGATTQWTPSTGSNYACVDEVPPVATDYVKTNAADQIDSYAIPDLPAVAGVVLGVEETIFASRLSFPTPTRIKHLVRHSGTDYPDSTGQVVPLLSTIPLRKCWGQNPGTGPADWAVADVNSLEVGFKSAA